MRKITQINRSFLPLSNLKKIADHFKTSQTFSPISGIIDYEMINLFYGFRHIEEITMTSNRRLEDLETNHAKALQEYHNKVKTLESEINNLENQLRKRDTSIHSKLLFLYLKPVHQSLTWGTNT